MKVANHAILIAVGAMFTLPFVFVLLTSLMTTDQALTPELWPDHSSGATTPTCSSGSRSFRYAANTMTIACLSTVGVLVSSIPVAYALSRLRWRGPQADVRPDPRDDHAALPGHDRAALRAVRALWLDPVFKPLIVPLFFGDAFSIFLLRQFFMTIPEELSDAARIDGASEWQIMTRVIVPLAKPAIAAVALFQFLYSWNDFFAPLLFLSDNPELWTLAIGLNEFRGLHQIEYNLMLAASVLFMLPVIVLFFLAQRVFMEGVTVTGVKG